MLKPINLQPLISWYLKATGDFGADFLNGDMPGEKNGFDELTEIMGNLASSLGVTEGDDPIPPVFDLGNPTQAALDILAERHRRDLVKAGALIIAELDRLDRAEQRKAGQT